MHETTQERVCEYPLIAQIILKRIQGNQGLHQNCKTGEYGKQTRKKLAVIGYIFGDANLHNS